MGLSTCHTQYPHSAYTQSTHREYTHTHTPHTGPQDLSNVAWGCQRVGFVDLDLLQAICRGIMRPGVLEGANEQSVANLAAGEAHTQHTHSTVGAHSTIHTQYKTTL